MREGWKEVRLNELCHFITDGAHLSPKSVDSGIPMASVKDMHDFGFNYNTCRQISFEDYIKLKKGNCEPQNNDVLIAKDGSYLKHCFVYKDEPKKLVLLSSIAIFRPDIDKIIPEFLAYLFKSDDVKGKARNYVSGVAIPRIVLSDFKKMTLLIPPLPTQRKIASILSSYDDLIENNLKRIKLLEEKAQRTYEEWFVKMRFPGHETAVFNQETGLPEGWEKKEAQKIFNIKIGKTPPREQDEWFRTDNSGIKWSSIKDINNASVFIFDTSESITQQGVEKFNMNVASKGTVILSFKLTVGKVTILTEDMVTNEAIAHFNLPNESILNSSYIYLYLKNFNYNSLGSTSSIGTALNSKIVKVIPFILPDNQTIIEFQDLLNPIFILIENLIRENRLLKEARDILLPRLMSGMVDVEELVGNEIKI